MRLLCSSSKGAMLFNDSLHSSKCIASSGSEWWIEGTGSWLVWGTASWDPVGVPAKSEPGTSRRQVRSGTTWANLLLPISVLVSQLGQTVQAHCHDVSICMQETCPYRPTGNVRFDPSLSMYLSLCWASIPVPISCLCEYENTCIAAGVHRALWGAVWHRTLSLWGRDWHRLRERDFPFKLLCYVDFMVTTNWPFQVSSRSVCLPIRFLQHTQTPGFYLICPHNRAVTERSAVPGDTVRLGSSVAQNRRFACDAPRCWAVGRRLPVATMCSWALPALCRVLMSATFTRTEEILTVIVASNASDELTCRKVLKSGVRNFMSKDGFLQNFLRRIDYRTFLALVVKFNMRLSREQTFQLP
jgi:hypothetical protein